MLKKLATTGSTKLVLCKSFFHACYLITFMNDIRVILMKILSANESTHGNVKHNKRLQVSLMEPTIEYIMKYIFNGLSQGQVSEVLAELGLMKNQQDFGSVSCVSVVLHHLLNELPIEIVSSNALQMLHLIEFSKDYSFDQNLEWAFQISEEVDPNWLLIEIGPKCWLQWSAQSRKKTLPSLALCLGSCQASIVALSELHIT
nr:uncharacterized protein LOC112766248 isoform X2 [Arachis hypogaea]